MMLLLILACSPNDAISDMIADPRFPEPSDWGPIEGPGGPDVVYESGELFEHCAYLLGDDRDSEHHNLVVMHDGYLWMPWAPEDGGGGITIYDFSDPCEPVKVGEGYSEFMRESHSLSFGIVDGREYMAVDYHDDSGDEQVGGIGFWDVTDRTAPVWVSELAVPEYHYPDAYFRVVLSTFWQGDVLYASAGLLGVFVVDVSDPLHPELRSTFQLEPSLLTGAFHVIGNVAMMSNAGTMRTAMIDVSDPFEPQLLPSGEFDVSDDSGNISPYYFANIGGDFALFARKDLAGGPTIYDISDPRAPVFLSSAPNFDGDGGYIFRHEDKLFVGDSNMAGIYDISDPAQPIHEHELNLQGDLDTMTPIGNVAVLSVDDGGAPGQATAVAPWRELPDDRGPVLALHVPLDGEVDVATTGRIGLSFDEMIEGRSVFEGSFRVGRASDGEPIPGRFNTQESLVNFTPSEPLEPNTSYVVSVPAGGIVDVSGNPTETSAGFTFTTGGR